MATRKNGHEYEISDEFWHKIKPLLLSLNPKRNLEYLEKMIKES